MELQIEMMYMMKWNNEVDSNGPKVALVILGGLDFDGWGGAISVLKKQSSPH